jgi:excisionase family DNA binding protein
MNEFTTKNSVNPFDEINSKVTKILRILETQSTEDHKSPEKKYMSTDDVCLITGITMQALYKQIHLKRIKSFKVGRKLFFKAEAIQAFIEGDHTPESILK